MSGPDNKPVERLKSPTTRSQPQRAGRSSTGALLSLGVSLILLLLVFVGLNYAMPGRFYSRLAIGVAVVLLIVRLALRRNQGRRSRAAEPDPESRLNLQ